MTPDETTGLVSERRQIAGIVLVAAAAVAALGLAWLRPLQARLAETRAQSRQVERDIRAFVARNSQAPLARQLADVRTAHEAQLLEWSDLRVRTDSFRGWPSLLQKLPKLEDGRIDFKVALFTVQARVQEGATNRGAAVTEDLGMPETLGADERPGTRLWQLATTVKLVEQALSAGVPMIDRLKSQRPFAYDVLDEPETVSREFPVEIGLRCGYDSFRRLLDGMLQTGTFFALRGIRLEVRERAEAPRVVVRAVCGGVLYQLREAAEAAVAPEHDGAG